MAKDAKNLSPKRGLASMKRSFSSPKKNKNKTPEKAYADDDDDDDDDDDILNQSFVKRILDAESGDATPDDKSGSKLDAFIKTDKESRQANNRVSFRDVDSLVSENSLSEKTMQQLVEKIEKLALQKRQAEIDLTAEKVTRKKKDRSLVKLAKELNKRTDATEKTSKQITQLENVATTLTKKLSTAKEELDESAQAQQKQSKMHHTEITAQQEKYRNACQDYNAQTEAFRREVLEANLTADKLRAKLARLEMAHSPDDVDIIAARTMQSMETPEKVENYNKVLAKVGGIAVLVLAAAYQQGMLSMHAVCAPAMPGTALLNDDTISLEAPWWAPAPLKSSAFAVCGARTRTRVDWLGESGKLTVVDVTKDDGKVHVVLDKRALSAATVFPEHIILTDKRGKSDNVTSPWTTLN